MLSPKTFTPSDSWGVFSLLGLAVLSPGFTIRDRGGDSTRVYLRLEGLKKEKERDGMVNVPVTSGFKRVEKTLDPVTFPPSFLMLRLLRVS